MDWLTGFLAGLLTVPALRLAWRWLATRRRDVIDVDSTEWRQEMVRRGEL